MQASRTDGAGESRVAPDQKYKTALATNCSQTLGELTPFRMPVIAQDDPGTRREPTGHSEWIFAPILIGQEQSWRQTLMDASTFSIPHRLPKRHNCTFPCAKVTLH